MAIRSLHGQFALQVALTPDAVAVVADGRRLTYRELDVLSDRLAQRLQELGAGPEVPVAVLMERGPDLVAATLAVLRTGAFYVPLHSSYPRERLERILAITGAPLLVTDAVLRERGLPDSDAVVVDAAAATAAAAPTAHRTAGAAVGDEDLAYALFTSGSTGEPKGVAVTHRDALGLAQDRCWDGGAHDRVLMVSPYAFGMSTYELWVPLTRGGTIVVPPAGDLDVPTLRRLIDEHDVTVVHLTAGLFRVVAEEAPESLRQLREVMTGGDVIAPAAVAKVLDACPGLVVRAMYGATETTLFTSNEVITAPYRPGTRVSTGRPMDGMRAYVLDDRLAPVVQGAEGELYVAGVGVARGYLGRPDLTAERFVPDPFAGAGQRMYRTGDLARWTADGRLELVGRADHQVKIRGFRVELAELEVVLGLHPGVADAVAVAQDGDHGDKRLIAYVVPAAGSLDLPGLRAFVAERLPDFMLPAALAVMDTFPLTANGKLDRDALPRPDTSAGPAPARSATPLQAALCTMFADILGSPDVGVDDDFFDLYGQSMQAIRLTLRIAEETGTRITIPEFYDNPTPGQLARFIEHAQRTAA